VERKQRKWFVYAGVLLILTIPVGAYLPAAIGALFGLIIAFVPVAAGIAILRYRLFDIDRVINRTLVYGLLTAILGLAYATIVLVLGQVFGGVSRDPPNSSGAGRSVSRRLVSAPLLPACSGRSRAVHRSRSTACTRPLRSNLNNTRLSGWQSTWQSA
jgi:hypothetical protein